MELLQRLLSETPGKVGGHWDVIKSCRPSFSCTAIEVGTWWSTNGLGVYPLWSHIKNVNIAGKPKRLICAMLKVAEIVWTCFKRGWFFGSDSVLIYLDNTTIWKRPKTSLSVTAMIRVIRVTSKNNCYHFRLANYYDFLSLIQFIQIYYFHLSSMMTYYNDMSRKNTSVKPEEPAAHHCDIRCTDQCMWELCWVAESLMVAWTLQDVTQCGALGRQVGC